MSQERAAPEGSARNDAREREERPETGGVPEDAKLLQGYFLDRFRTVLGDRDPAEKERGMETLRALMRERLALSAGQRSSLQEWMDRLASPDARYPDDLKHRVLQSVLRMGEYDKKHKQFTTRNKHTAGPFPELNAEALSFILEAMERGAAGQAEKGGAYTEDFLRLLRGGNFAKLYTYAVNNCASTSEERLRDTEGTWVLYPRGSDPAALVKSLRGYNTGLCVATAETAETLLEDESLYVYYSRDARGNPAVPRAGIRAKGSRIVAVRGIAERQHLDAWILPVIERKLGEFSDGRAQGGDKVACLHRLSDIERRQDAGDTLAREDLRFLYEVDGAFEGFGYEQDPRMTRLLAARNPEDDMPVIFGCARERIARRPEDIRGDTKAYVGPLEDGIFRRFGPSVEYVYSSFPYGRIRRETVDAVEGGPDGLRSALRARSVQMGGGVRGMLESAEAGNDAGGKDRALDVVRLRVGDLGIDGGASVREIFRRGRELGLELCPAETGPRYLLSHADWKHREWCYIAMEPIGDGKGRPHIFQAGSNAELELHLLQVWAGEGAAWDADREVVFALPGRETGGYSF